MATTALAQSASSDFNADCKTAGDGRLQRVVCADLVALDQMLVYNRFGSFNPYGMIFALRRDVVSTEGQTGGLATPEGPDCADDTGTHRAPSDALTAGQVRLRDCRRPRPLVLRANVGDLLFLRVTNLLAPNDSADEPARDLSKHFCPNAGPHISVGSKLMVDHAEALCADAALTAADDAEPGEAGEVEPEPAGDPVFEAGDWPRTRSLNLLAEGLMPIAIPGGGDIHPACRGLGAVAPQVSFDCLYEVVQEGTHFFASRAAPAGGEGDGGSITHGLFGAVLAERPGTRWYRSQVSQAAMDAAWSKRGDGPLHARSGAIDYEKTINGIPVLNMARALDGSDFRAAGTVEIVHTDLNAIIWCDPDARLREGYGRKGPLGCMDDTAEDNRTEEPRFNAFREFSVFFHDELKTFYTRNFEELARFGQLAGVRDGFAINYGASGMGTLLLANRKGIGPAATCVECLYEEFFLTSWANGDPALLEWYDDDPSNVHHSYLNDPVVFRNFHAGPKETHVFHLHAHQWFAGNDAGRGSYLDSQTVAPGQGFTYNIYHGGRGNQPGGWTVGGSGNRNRTIGDSIFHCHLYPHFAQGMWALWRVHDVFEDGTRMLPDGQAEPGLSADIRDARGEAEKYFEPENPGSLTNEERKYLAEGEFFARTGSVDPESGQWLDHDDKATTGRLEGAGTPIPALVPLPGEALPPLPTYATPKPETPHQPQQETRLTPPRPLWRGLAAGGPERLIRAQSSITTGKAESANDPSKDTPIDAMPGYPFYIAGTAGHRPPQAPHDIAREIGSDGNLTKTLLSGGLGRHVITGGERKLPLNLTDKILKDDGDLAADLNSGDNRARLETLRSQIVAKALALGDMTAHLEKIHIRALPPRGTRLERAAQAFHYDGKLRTYAHEDMEGSPTDTTDPATLPVLTVRAVDGTPVAQDKGSYPTLIAPLPGRKTMAPGAFQVNGAPPAPGAPFADPCGGATGREGIASGTDPLTNRPNYRIDPSLRGFRRYEVSAVQLDLVVNQAGWHDPQARIDVLTSTSDKYKLPLGEDDGNRISPTTRDDAQPFFFRALSGECIEFRHTNELPKELALDDFQVRTPTDTIGQHIHLVKFDVTSSDGSGNGWNYEDGTFAADELMARRCAALHEGSLEPSQPDAKLGDWGTRPATDSECHNLNNHRIWRLPLKGNRDLFQTTVQRWFADPIMTMDGANEARDRTMRTVFSHDHFGPSSIQQHGFYTALLVEPKKAFVCDPHVPGTSECSEVPSWGKYNLQTGDERWIGTHKIIKGYGENDPIHPDYREFALAIADFALLYDPRDREEESALGPREGAEHKGMARLHCEALSALSDTWLGVTASQCGLPDPNDPDMAPAWWAAGAPGDRPMHTRRLHGNLMDEESVTKLRADLVEYRKRAASPEGVEIVGANLAKPVAPPDRPESISVDHHDPYLVNYRNAPIPLRLGTKESSGARSSDCAPLAMTRAGLTSTSDSTVVEQLKLGKMPSCSFAYQLAGIRGDAAYALSSRDPANPDTAIPTRDPETAILEAYQDERILFRLVQGAQEVQHVFNLAGVAGTRNIDQRYSQGMRDLAVSIDPARRACFEKLRHTHPEGYDDWLNATPLGREKYEENRHQVLDRFDDFERALAQCDNIEGYTFAQEVGISEHFEIRTRLRSDVPVVESNTQVQSAAAQPTGTKDVSDYLYNFGTLDALWNGAWGLTRVYAGQAERTALLDRWHPHPEGAPDQSAAPPVLVPITEAGRNEADSDAGPTVQQPNEAPVCPLPGNPLLGHQTAGLVVALRTADAWPDGRLYDNNRVRGTDYEGHRFDPDGMMLALIDPSQLREKGRLRPRDIGDDAHWDQDRDDGMPGLARNDVLDAVRAAYSRPEPFVMRVNAGDCVVLRYVNLLQESAPGGGLPDGLGDALMPRITPLNVDPEAEVSRTITRSADGKTASTKVTGTLTAQTMSATGLRPSARLGLSVGLPGGDLIRNLPLGYGINAPAMEPARAGLAEVSGELRFFAGRMRIAPPKGLAIDPADIELHKHIHWIPYAFGPVPVRVTGDMVSQTPHGLFGVIDVLPKGWTIPDPLQRPGAAPDSYRQLLGRLAAAGVADGNAPWRWRTTSVPRQFGAPALYRDVGLDPDNPWHDRQDIREFVIFYQDGLNHHDYKSKIQWNWDEDSLQGQARPTIPKIAPDCLICDDSYDLGDQGVSYRSRPFASLLRYRDIAAPKGRIEASDDLNAVEFPPDFFDRLWDETERRPLTLQACPGEQVLIRVVHPGGRARQRAFVMNGLGYDDLFPGFGFPNAALLAPGKTVSAWLHPPTVIGPDGSRTAVEGRVLWHDGPTFLMAGGTWGLVEFTNAVCTGAAP